MRFIFYIIGFYLMFIANKYWAAAAVWIWGELLCSYFEIIGQTNTQNEQAYTNDNQAKTCNQEIGQEEAYVILGVEPTASDGDIKRAYRQLALTYHPDVCSDAEAASKFRVIHDAYETIKTHRGFK